MSIIVTLPLPITLLNGTLADAGQVMSDLLAIASNVNANAAKNGVNSDITALTALVSIAPGLTITGATITASTFIGGSIVGTAIDATSTVPTAALGTTGNGLASLDFVNQQAFSTVLPAQAGNAGKSLQTNGFSAFWALINLATGVTGILPVANGGSSGMSGAPDYLLFAQGVI